MKPYTATCFLAWLLLLALWACDGLDEHYSTNPNDRLSFSIETLSFDTVFSTIGSATKSFMIYNTNNRPLLIDEVTLAGAGSTGFRINVDGRKGDHFESIRIGAADSLYVFVEVTINPTKQDQPLLVADSILFRTNNTQQVVRLEAYGQDIHLYKEGVTLTEDTHFTSDRPYLIYDSLVIAPNTTLTIAPGATLYLHNTAQIIVSGSLLAEGTVEAPITLRGDRMDDILNDVLPYDRTPSQWDGIIFHPESFDNKLSHTIVRNATTGITCETSTPDQSKLQLQNCQITNMGGDLFTANNCHIEITGCELTNAGGNIARLTGGNYRFVHCTLANYISLVHRTASCLSLTNHANGEDLPLQVSFANCIIDGSFDAGKEPCKGELSFSINESTDCSYNFSHCVIKSVDPSNEHFTNCIFTDSSLNYQMMGGEKYLYQFDFRPTEETLGRGLADPTISSKYLYDRYGVSRLEDQSPDIGAYEYIPEAKE